MPNGNSNTNVVAGTLILLTVLAGVFALAWHKTFTGAEVFGIVTTIVSLAGGAFAVHSGVKAGSEAATPTPTPAPPDTTSTG